jgi:hypothetical protein
MRLAGAAGALRKSIGAEQYAEEFRRQQAWQQPLYEERGEKICAEARAVGRRMSLESAIDEALAGEATGVGSGAAPQGV